MNGPDVIAYVALAIWGVAAVAYIADVIVKRHRDRLAARLDRRMRARRVERFARHGADQPPSGHPHGRI